MNRNSPIAVLLLLLLSASPETAGATSGIENGKNLAPGFASWALKAPELTYRELAHRFVSAGGRDAEDYEAAISRLELGFKKYLAERQQPTTPSVRANALRDYIFGQQKFTADLDLEDVENLFPDSIIERKQGFCLGLSLVLVDLGERLGWPLAIASAPRHTFVRYQAPRALNIETTQNGEIHGDGWYRSRYQLDASDSTRLRTLTVRDTAAHLVNNYGFALLQSGHHEAAAREFVSALKLFGQLIEARINLGVLAARRGHFKEALGHFDQALAAWPQDGYLKLNRANTLIAMKRTDAAAEQMLALIGSDPGLPGLANSVDQFKQLLSTRIGNGNHKNAEEDQETKNWLLLQRVSTAYNQTHAKRVGRQPGLTGTYFKDAKLEQVAWTRVDKDISFRWSWDSPGRGIPRDHFSVRWQGWLEVPRRDRYNFFVTCSDGIRIWIDGRQVLDSWRRANDSFPRASFLLEPGLHDIRIEYFESIGEAGISMILTARSDKYPLRLDRHLSHPVAK